MRKTFSRTEEDYLKTIYRLGEKCEDGGFVSTNAIADKLKLTAASVTDMIKRLAEKDLLVYQRYKGVQLQPRGEAIAKHLVRKHRLWEVFLVEKLAFKWDEVHDIAEQLEHIQSLQLTDRLEKFLNYPQNDPHGDPIPDRNGVIPFQQERYLADMQEGEVATIVGVDEHEPAFLRYLEQQTLLLGTSVKILRRYTYDNSLELELEGSRQLTISQQVSKNLYVAVETKISIEK